MHNSISKLDSRVSEEEKLCLHWRHLTNAGQAGNTVTAIMHSSGGTFSII